jgi:hypothetical protein
VTINGEQLRQLGDRMDNAQVGAAGRFWQLCEAQERGEHPTASKRVLVGLVGRRVVKVMFGVLLRDLTRTPELFTSHIAALANGFVREVGESLQPFGFAERVSAFNGLVRELAAGLQVGVAEEVKVAPTPPAWAPTHRHVATGGLYQVVDDNALEATNGTAEGTRIVVYRNEAGRHFARHWAEFMDGRFEAVEPAGV